MPSAHSGAYGRKKSSVLSDASSKRQSSSLSDAGFGFIPSHGGGDRVSVVLGEEYMVKPFELQHRLGP